MNYKMIAWATLLLGVFIAGNMTDVGAKNDAEVLLDVLSRSNPEDTPRLLNTINACRKKGIIFKKVDEFACNNAMTVYNQNRATLFLDARITPDNKVTLADIVKESTELTEEDVVEEGK
jgi:hypothetical protein